MSVISKLKLERLASPFDSFPFPFIHFTLPPEGFFTFSHEVSHLLQFKRREVDRWLKSGKFVFLTENEPHFRPRRECETEVIEYKLSQLYADYYLTDSFFREEKGSQRDKYYLRARKVYNKRLLKKRAKYINEVIDNNLELINTYRTSLKYVNYYIATLDCNHPASIILRRMFTGINNTYKETFNVPEDEIESTIHVLENCKVDFRVSEDGFEVII